MEPITLITSALTAGIAALGKETVKAGAKDAYNGLKALVARRFKDKKNEEGALALKKHEQKPEVELWGKALEDELLETGAEKDAEIIKAAQELMNMLKPRQAATGKFNMQAENIQGAVQADKIDNLTQNFGK